MQFKFLITLIKFDLFIFEINIKQLITSLHFVFIGVFYFLNNINLILILY